jgi:hypothetical protein
MARYAPELVALVRHRYEQTDDTLAKIAADCGISERTVNRMRDRGGWARRGERPRGLPQATRALQEATALLARPPNPCGPSDLSCVHSRASGNPVLPEEESAGSPLARGRTEEGLPLHPDAAGAHAAENGKATAIARIERLVEKELAAEEAMRAQLGPLPRPPADAERSARTLATLTQTLHALARLRAGRPADLGADDDDDMPRDIDEFRRELARRIDAFVASRTEPRPAHADAKPADLDQAG